MVKGHSVSLLGMEVSSSGSKTTSYQTTLKDMGFNKEEESESLASVGHRGYSRIL
jgi:hypothetical protein